MFILGAGFAMALAAAGLLLVSGRQPDRWLAAMGLCAGLATGAHALARVEAPGLGEAWSYLTGPAFMALPVLFHLYIRAMAGQLRMLDYLWFAPVALYAFGMAGAGLARPDSVDIQAGLVTINGPAGAWLTPLPILATLALPVLGLIEIGRRRVRLEASFAELARRDLAWARALLWMNLAVILCSGILAALAARLGLAASVKVFDLFIVFLAIQLAAIVHFSARERAPSLEPVRQTSRAGAAARLDAAALNALLDDVDLLTKPDLRIRDVADSAGLPVEDFSHALRASLGESFFDYVNRKRLERAQALFADPQRASSSVLDLAFEAGFQSKATFNRVFRERTGQTPSQWRAAIRF